MTEAKRTELTPAEELGLLRKELARLLRENDRLNDQLAERESSKLVEVNHQLLRQVAELEVRAQKLEEENRGFANMCVQVQEQNEALANLYVASHRLHATIDPAEVMKIILEILVELVGAEEFGIFVFDEKRQALHLMAGEGIEGKLPLKSLPAGEGVIGEVAATGEPFYFEPKSPSEVAARLPLAAVPLNMNGHPVGVIVIYKLLRQKTGFSTLDHQLLQQLAADAATALASAQLHSAMDRKLRTIEGFVQLMKP